MGSEILKKGGLPNKPTSVHHQGPSAVEARLQKPQATLSSPLPPAWTETSNHATTEKVQALATQAVVVSVLQIDPRTQDLVPPIGEFGLISFQK